MLEFAMIPPKLRSHTLNFGVALLVSLSSAQNAQATETLRIFSWGEYIKPELIAKFEQENKVKVTVDNYGSNEEMLAKLQAGGVSQYDVIVPSDYIMSSLIALKLLQPLELKQIPNFKNLAPKFQNPKYDPGNRYSVGYAWGSVGLLYQKAKFKTPPSSWGVLLDPKQVVGKFLLMDSTRELMGVALKYQRHSLNTLEPTQVQAAGKLILEAKKSPMCLGFAADVGLKNRVLSGEAVLAMVYSGDGVRATLENRAVGFVLPKEGASINIDSLAIPAKAPNPKLAHRFINFILEAKNGAENAIFHGFPTPNQAALQFTPATIRNNPQIYPPVAFLNTLEFIQDLGQNNRLYDEVWTAIKSN